MLGTSASRPTVERNVAALAIHRGQPVTLDDGRVIDPTVLVGPTRPGRHVVITGDTRPCRATVEGARLS